ncbi:PH domain-containing protein [Microbulbifer halophilus]|uniref:PH domain-containing protein n=1 Tax=Microbulbifer halophilus TaxID=453963 RepID=A0ABW5E6Q2_9GAMM|nr:PH domain-containing protein [Microbulbifer halophilus]MCW8126138.1 PH domain-containing protein [Microbulbifer halophilus]
MPFSIPTCPQGVGEIVHDTDFQDVSSRYLGLLRLNLSLWLVAALAGTVGAQALWAAAALVPLLAGGAAAVLLVGLMVFWAPRRARYTRYRVGDGDVRLHTGAWWRTALGVPTNRIQHLEITQGPLERRLDLSRLALFTAGGQGSDLKIPGLRSDTARALKAELLARIAAEEQDGEEAALAES